MGAKVSICIPCYNNADEVERLLKSVYCQNYTDFEVNLSDDSTNGETENLVRTKYPNVTSRSCSVMTGLRTTRVLGNMSRCLKTSPTQCSRFRAAGR